MAAGVERIALGGGALHPDLVGAAGERDRQRGVEREADPAQPFGPEEALVDQRVFGLGQCVQVPAVEVAELLAELADVHPEPAGQAGPVDVALLDAYLVVLEGEEDLGVGVGSRADCRATSNSRATPLSC